MPYVRRTKRRPSLSRKLKIAATICVTLAFALVVGGMVVAYQERLARGAAEAAQYTPPPFTPATEPTSTDRETITAAFLGDSYTEGAGSSQDRESRWTTLVANELGWTEENFGVGGTGYVQGESYATRVEDVVASDPDVVVVSGGRNDLSASVGEVQANASELFSELRTELPDATIIAISPWWDASPAPSELEAISSAVEAAAAESDVTFIDGGQPLAGQATLLSEDQIHPNNDGYAALADAVTEALRMAAS